MSRKHNARHPNRGRSRYPERLEARGLSRAPRMEPLEPLRKRQEARVERGEPPWYVRAAWTDEP